MKDYKKYQDTILSSIKKLNKTGFLQGTGGNLSVRIPGEDAIAVTPSQREYDTLKIDDICIIDFDLNPIIDNGLKPGAEFREILSKCYEYQLDNESDSFYAYIMPEALFIIL